MPFPVKICGITRTDDALLAEALGAFAVGFIFYPLSPRYIEPERVGEISRTLGNAIQRVGVFVNEDTGKIREVVRAAGLTTVQLHGEENPEYIRALGGIPVIKAFRVRAEFDPEMLREYPADYFLLDTYAAGSRGGTGKSFDWTLAARCAGYGRVLLAGGLNDGNVAEAVRIAHPWGVDISSGVEISPGIKDRGKMLQVFEALSTRS